MSSKFTIPAIDKAVFEWFCSIRKLRGAKKPLPVTQALITARAMLEARIRGHVDFKASNGWFDHWRWRYNVKKSVRLQGEAGDIDIAAVEQDIEMLHCALKEYSPGNIFNMDETGLFFRAILNHSYLMANEGTSDRKGEAAKL